MPSDDVVKGMNKANTPGNCSIAERLSGISISGIREVFAAAEKLKGRLINLGIGEPDFDTPEHIKRAAEEAIRQGYTHYTVTPGIRELREAVADKVREVNKLEARPEEVIITAGATQALFLTLSVLVRSGEEVVIPSPSFPAFAAITRVVGGVPKEVPMDYSSGFVVEPERLSRVITPRTRALILNTPSNPTGAVQPRKVLEELANIALANDLYIISDEVYENFVYEGEHISIGSLDGVRERVITINSFSKTYAMTGWRLGYAVATEALVSEMAKLQTYTVVCPASFVQKAAIAAIQGPQAFLKEMREEYRRRRDFVCEALKRVEGLDFYKPSGAFYVFPRLTKWPTSSYDFCMRILAEKGVCLVPGTAFGEAGEGFFRLSYAAPIEKLQRGIGAIAEFLKAQW